MAYLISRKCSRKTAKMMIDLVLGQSLGFYIKFGFKRIVEKVKIN